MDHNERTPSFKIGDLVVARSSDQGLVAGEHYSISDWAFEAMEFGVRAVYVLQPEAGGEQVTVADLHELVEHAE